MVDLRWKSAWAAIEPCQLELSQLSGCAEDSVEIALDFFKSVGAYLQDVNLGGYNM